MVHLMQCKNPNGVTAGWLELVGRDLGAGNTGREVHNSFQLSTPIGFFKTKVKKRKKIISARLDANQILKFHESIRSFSAMVLPT